MSTSLQIPNNQVHEALGEVNVRRTPNATHIHATILIQPELEGIQTGLALDGSSSLRAAYGRRKKTPPAELMQDLLRKGLLQASVSDGRQIYTPTPEAIRILEDKGFWGNTENIMEQQTREMLAYLATEVDADGQTSLLYWACGEDGRQTQTIGDFAASKGQQLSIEGPTHFGEGTFLLPAIRTFVDRFPTAKFGFYVFFTDGALDDLEAVKQYTIQLAKEIAAGRRNPVKCILIGIGSQIQRTQMEELDDLKTGTDIDIWDHKIAEEMRSLKDLFAEVIDEHMIIAPEGEVLDHKGKVVKRYTAGLPASIQVALPPDATSFTIKVGDLVVTQALPKR